MRKIKSSVVNERPIIKSIFTLPFLIIFIAIMNIGGCVGDEDTCNMSCRVGSLGCPGAEEDCECAGRSIGCAKSSFKNGKCVISKCNCEFRIFFPSCPRRETTQQDITLSEPDFVTVFPLGEACDVIASADTENNCADLTIDRECESFEFIQSEDGGLLNECWLYDCQQCLL